VRFEGLTVMLLKIRAFWVLLWEYPNFLKCLIALIYRVNKCSFSGLIHFVLFTTLLLTVSV